MCFSVTFPDTGENWTKFLYSTKKGRDLFAFTVSNLDKDEISKVCFIGASLQVMRNVHSILQKKLEWLIW